MNLMDKVEQNYAKEADQRLSPLSARGTPWRFMCASRKGIQVPHPGFPGGLHCPQGEEMPWGDTFRVRKISSGIGVERVFPFHSPNVEKVEVVAWGKTRQGQALLPERNDLASRPELPWIMAVKNKLTPPSTSPSSSSSEFVDFQLQRKRERFVMGLGRGGARPSGRASGGLRGLPGYRGQWPGSEFRQIDGQGLGVADSKKLSGERRQGYPSVPWA